MSRTFNTFNRSKFTQGDSHILRKHWTGYLGRWVQKMLFLAYYQYINHTYILDGSERVQKPIWMVPITKDRIPIGWPDDYLFYYYSTFSNNNNQMKLLRNLKLICFTWLGLKFITWLFSISVPNGPFYYIIAHYQTSKLL